MLTTSSGDRSPSKLGPAQPDSKFLLVLKTLRSQRNLSTVHAAAAWFMVGLMWTIHFVHYPLFAQVGDDNFVAYETAHVDRIGNLLLLPWLTEGITLLGLLWIAIHGSRRDIRIPAIVNAVSMGIVLAISGFWSAPAHGKLLKGFDPDVHGRLMNADLVRTIAWTVCGVTALQIVQRLWSERNS